MKSHLSECIRAATGGRVSMSMLWNARWLIGDGHPTSFWIWTKHNWRLYEPMIHWDTNEVFLLCWGLQYMWLHDVTWNLKTEKPLFNGRCATGWWDANHLETKNPLISRHLKTATLLREIENGWWLCYLPSKWHSHWSWHLQNLAGHELTCCLGRVTNVCRQRKRICDVQSLNNLTPICFLRNFCLATSAHTHVYVYVCICTHKKNV